MKISLKWLKKYIPLDYDPEKIGEMLTTIGLEVEGIEEVEMIKGGLKGVVVGHVMECGKHPNADKLSLCKVDIGEDEYLQIVCGAPNVAAGQKVLVATIGTVLYDDKGEPWKIKKGKIRGELSQGMICAEDELGLGDSHDGILVLDPDEQISMDASTVFKLESDIVFDIGLTPNRSDATSHIGVAEDLAAYININETEEIDIDYPDLSSFNVDNDTNAFKVSIEDEERCPRYSGISFSDVEVKESPSWLKNHLISIGVRPISNIVDITNFILHEYGQPLHAFDADKIENKSIIVKCLPDKSEFLSLDEQTRKLDKEDLIICDDRSKPLCIAGVFGGLDSGVTEKTTNIFLESAHFSANSVRKTSTRHLLRTDAAICFEKGSDPNITVKALKRAAILIKELAGATISSKIVDEYPKEIKPTVIHLRYEKVNELIGNVLEKEEIHNILSALRMEINPMDADSVKVSIPTNKSDVTREVDLIEEILRIYGFNKIVTDNKIRSTISYSNNSNRNAIKNKIRTALSSQGFNEMMNLSLIESRLYDKALPIDKEKMVFINNTSNVHLDIMRPEMLLCGLQSIQHNLNRQQVDVKLYEFGKQYLKDGEGFDEREKLCLFISGRENYKTWNHKDEAQVDFYHLKENVNNLMDRLGIVKFQIEESENNKYDYGLRYFRGNAQMVSFGKISDEITKAMDIKQEVFFAEFDIQQIVKSAKTKLFVETISKYPVMRRDLAMVIDEQVKFSKIQSIVEKADKKLIKNVGLFDVYKNEKQLGKGKKSYALSILFENSEKTLNDKLVDNIVNKIIKKAEEQLGAVVRN